jgi:acyl-CoA synthetase (AMP-forming)/AMP-acid ligase II
MTSQLQALSLTYEPLHKGQDVVLGYLPFSHMFSFTLLVMQILTVGVPLVVLPRFDESAWLSAIEKYKITWALCVPPVLIVLRNSSQLERYKLDSLRGMMSAAAPLSEDLCVSVEKRLPKCKITQGYGECLCGLGT